MSGYSNNNQIDLQLLEELAANFFNHEEISLMMDIPVAWLSAELKRPGSEVRNAFYKGRLQSEFEVRKSIVQMAKQGSSPAQTASLDMINKSKIKMLDL